MQQHRPFNIHRMYVWYRTHPTAAAPPVTTTTTTTTTTAPHLYVISSGSALMRAWLACHSFFSALRSSSSSLSRSLSGRKEVATPGSLPNLPYLRGVGVWVGGVGEVGGGGGIKGVRG
jgi:hypothetical protein